MKLANLTNIVLHMYKLLQLSKLTRQVTFDK